MGVTSMWDLDTSLAVYPPGEGFYIGEYEGEVVSSAIRIPWSDGNPSVYYGSCYYVEEKYRGKGFGTRLRDQVAFGHVGDNILCVDAVMGSVARKNADKFRYVSAGFKTMRYEIDAPESVGIQLAGGSKIVPVSEC